jgi:hypothetical protein
MKFEYEVLDEDLGDREKIIRMKEEIIERIGSLSEFGQNTMVRSIKNTMDELEYAEQEWLNAQRERLWNRFSYFLNIQRESLEEKHRR